MWQLNATDGNLIVNTDENLLCLVVSELRIMKGTRDLCVTAHYSAPLDESSFVVGLGCSLASTEQSKFSNEEMYCMGFRKQQLCISTWHHRLCFEVRTLKSGICLLLLKLYLVACLFACLLLCSLVCQFLCKFCGFVACWGWPSIGVLHDSIPQLLVSRIFCWSPHNRCLIKPADWADIFLVVWSPNFQGYRQVIVSTGWLIWCHAWWFLRISF